MSSEVRSWGRDDEVESLVLSVLERPRSASLLYGDSGIGKTTVLRTVRSRLAVCPNVIVGFYEASVADPDPILRALDDLLRQIYTVQGILDQLRIACQNLQSHLSLEDLKSFLLGASVAMAEGAGLKTFASAAMSAFGWVADKATGLDAQVPLGLMPKLGIHTLRDILRVLHEALPGRILTLIVDNLSAPAEALAAEIRGFGSIDTVQAFLSQDFASSKVHFLFSWKLNEQTHSFFQRFSGITKQYGGELIPLAPIQDQDALAEWCAAEFPWFRSLSADLQQDVVRLIGGLPEVVVRWREADMPRFEPHRLSQLAKEIGERRYPDLQRALRTASQHERELIYLLALVLHPMPVTNLADMLGCSPERCQETIRKWVERRLLRAAEGAPAYLPATYYSEH